MKLIDLTHELYNNCKVYPGDPDVRFKAHKTIKKSGCNLTELALGTHSGTHLDAPSHFLAGAKTVDKVILDKFYGPAIIVDLTNRSRKGELKIEDLLPYEKSITKGRKVLLRTGWHKNVNKNIFYKGYNGISIELAEWLVKKQVGLIGLETPSLHPSNSKLLHRILLSGGIVIVENLANLDKIKKSKVLFCALPLKLKGLDGSPVRAIAIE